MQRIGVITSTLALAALCGTASAQFAVQRLEADHKPASTFFNETSGHARLITILSPT